MHRDSQKRLYSHVPILNIVRLPVEAILKGNWVIKLKAAAQKAGCWDQYYNHNERRKIMLTIRKGDIKDYLDWIKLQISICSAAVGSFLFRFGDAKTWPTSIKVSTILFLFSMIMCLVSYVSLVEHKNSIAVKMSKKAGATVSVTWALFLFAFLPIIVFIF
jgi:hypothetical protein